jgi:D-xylose 1-dehydrogenase (NADP+, D-xylono-1,5-lactone-forming)
VAAKWGIISTARINRKFLAGARAAGEEILAVASRDEAAAVSYARANEIERAYGGYEALLADGDVEAVYISLPNSLHLEWAVRALEAGKHVLCEKPLGRSAAAVDAAFDVAEREGRLLMEAFMYRHHPQTQRLTELVAEAAVGRLRLIRASFSFASDDPANVRFSSALQGGALMDVGCYCVSASRLLAGEPVRVSGEQVLGGDGVDVVFAGTMRFPQDVVAHFDCGLVLAARDELEVVGDAGSLLVADPWHCLTPGIELHRGAEVEWIEIPSANSYGLEATDFSAAIAGHASPRLGRADAVAQARALEALYASAEAGRATVR